MPETGGSGLLGLVSFGDVFQSITVVVVTWLAIQLVGITARVLMFRLPKYRLQIGPLFPIARIVLWASAIFAIIFVIVAPTADAFLAVSASIGLALGLASQDIMRNVLGGIIIVLERPFRVGDMVKVGDHYGEVVSVGIRSVQLHTFDDSLVAVPNSVVISHSVSNANSGELSEMVVTEFVLPASADAQLVSDLAWEAAVSSPYTYLKKPVTVLVSDEFRETFLTKFAVKCYVSDIRLERSLSSDVMARIKGELLKREIITDEIVLGFRKPGPGERQAPPKVVASVLR